MNEDDSHPLDWYPEPDDDPRGVPIRIVQRHVDAYYGDEPEMVKLQGDPGNVCTVARASTTRLYGSPAMRFQRTMIRRLRSALRAEPRVYFFRCVTCGLGKIGYSQDYLRRRVEIEQRTGHVLNILGSVLGNRVDESIVHAVFAEYHDHGEWFRWSDAMLAYLRENADPARTEWPPFNRDGRHGVYQKGQP